MTAANSDLQLNDVKLDDVKLDDVKLVEDVKLMGALLIIIYPHSNE